MPSLEQTLTRSLRMLELGDSTLPLPSSKTLADQIHERSQLIGLVTRKPTLRGAPLADRIMSSKWLREHDDRIRQETIRDIVDAVERGEIKIMIVP